MRTIKVRWFIGAVALFILDRLTKQLAPSEEQYFVKTNWLNFFWQYASNSVGPLGISVSLVLAVVALATSIILLFLAAHYFSVFEKGTLSVALAGAVSNIVDRIWFGQVIDPFHFVITNWPALIFNLADVSIVLGAMLAAMSYYRRTI